MKRLLLSVLIASACSMAYAAKGGESGNTNCNGQGNPSSPCTGGGGGSGGAAPISQSRAEARAMALAIAAARAQATAVSSPTLNGGSPTATGIGGTGTGIGGGAQATAGGLDMRGAKIGGDTNYPRQTPPAYAPNGDKPPTSCRLFIGVGGSSPGGAASGGIPIGNDAICLHEKRDIVMRQANLRSPGTFGPDDFLRNDCTIEGMSDTVACRQLKERN